MVAEAFEAAYRRHATELIRYATVMVGPDDASDVVTDAMLGVFAERDDAIRIGDVRAFLFRSVHNRAVDHEREGTVRKQLARARARLREVLHD